MRTAPDYIQFYPTLRCNKSCDFCFNTSMAPMPDMPYEDFSRMLGTLRLIGVSTLDIIGGEPTLHTDLPRLIKTALLEGMKINLSSNGTDLIRLSEIMMHHPQVSVGISVNDQRTAWALEEFIAKHRPIVKMVAGLHVDASLVMQLLALKPKQFFLLYRDAPDAAQLNETIPFDQFWTFVNGRFDPRQVGTVSCSGFLPDYAHYPELLKARCPAGSTKLGIMPDGSVYPCNLFFGRQEFLLGNIFSDPFEDIWHHSSLAFFRTFTGNTCPRTTCVLHAKCHGGCPAHSYIHSGKRAAPEPRCKRT
ncbi:MAG: radical SAM/SPASM domain-containing protein [Nitrospirota bacterium]